MSTKCDQSTAWQILRQIWDSTLRQAQMLAYLQKILGTQGVANLESEMRATNAGGPGSGTTVHLKRVQDTTLARAHTCWNPIN